MVLSDTVSVYKLDLKRIKILFHPTEETETYRIDDVISGNKELG